MGETIYGQLVVTLHVSRNNDRMKHQVIDRMDCEYHLKEQAFRKWLERNEKLKWHVSAHFEMKEAVHLES